MDDKFYGILYAGLIILAMGLPFAGAVWLAQKRGKSARTAALFLGPYYTLPIVLLLWATGTKGIRLLAEAIGVVAVITPLLYYRLGIMEDRLRRSQDYPAKLARYEREIQRRKE
jgi:hypothetical protein